MSIAIKVENLSKKYIIQHEKKSANYETLSESLIQGGKNVANRIIHPFRKTNNLTQTEEEFWALKDINFEINQGDKVGIIGRNGAGKSTLLKVLSRITEPTSGKIHINGRIASLLEVGTGFHPELTGRENIYLNGAILGMSRKEIKLKFDEIVAFAEVDKFLDTPVKRYSSGMYMRLAFAVAANLESEILVIDEVLAVGDAEFQKKCLGKMDEVSKAGRTVLFVSHNMAAIEALCDHSLLIDQGELLKHDRVETILDCYQQRVSNIKGFNSLEQVQERSGLGDIQFNKFQFMVDGHSVNNPVTGKSVSIKLSFNSVTDRSFKNCRVGIAINDFFSDVIVLSTEMVMQEELSISGRECLSFYIKQFPLTAGMYHFRLFLESNKVTQDWIVDGLTFEVDDGDFYGRGKNNPDGSAGKHVLTAFQCEKYSE